MTTTYTIPFSIQDMHDLTYDDFMTLVAKHNIATRLSHRQRTITGTQEQMYNFYSGLNDGAQSFPMDDFLDFIKPYKDTPTLEGQLRSLAQQFNATSETESHAFTTMKRIIQDELGY